MWKTWIALLCVVAISKANEEEWRILKTSQGPVRGRRDPAGVDIFKNIPYATVPKGTRKFSEPLPAPAWLQTLDTPDKEIICPQGASFFVTTEDKIVQEECLIANIYVPVTEKKKLPVVVYIHGGAFEMGFGAMLTPINFVKTHNVIVVTFNYRLGVHGFLCLGTEAVPGNAGLKDQVALLIWVKKNIASYGGDSENVTIAGYSAGSVSVDLLMLSKLARGLFTKVVLESGASVGSIGVQRNPLENAQNLAKKLNFKDVENLQALEQFYKNTPLETMLNVTFFDIKNASVTFGPCVERKSSSAFLYDSPINIIKNGAYKKVPMLIGISDMEGLLQLPNFEVWSNDMNERFSDFLPADLDFESSNNKDEVAKEIKKFYFGDQIINEKTILSYIDYFSDVLFAYPTWKAAKMHAENGHKEIYLYMYTFVDDNSPAVPHTQVRGATHCAQTMSIFDGANFAAAGDESNLSEAYKKMKATTREMWYNFAVYGKPVPEGSAFPSWPTAGQDSSPHMNLGNTVELQESFIKSRAEFWDSIYQKHYKEPIPLLTPPHTEL